MSTLEDLDNLEREEKDKKQDQDGDGDGDGKKPEGEGDAEMKDADAGKKEEEDVLDEEVLQSSTADIVKRRRMLENELRIMKSEYQRLNHEQNAMREKVKDNQEKIENNRCVSVVPSSVVVTSVACLRWYHHLQATTIPCRKRGRAVGPGRRS